VFAPDVSAGAYKRGNRTQYGSSRSLSCTEDSDCRGIPTVERHRLPRERSARILSWSTETDAVACHRESASLRRRTGHDLDGQRSVNVSSTVIRTDTGWPL
jgi:hypothetical protein